MRDAADSDENWQLSADREMQRTLLKAFAWMGAFGLALWFVFAPYLALQSIRKAALRGDAGSLAELIEFPTLRENLKSRITAVFLEGVKASQPDASGFAGLGAMMGVGIAGMAVEAFITPRSIASMCAGSPITAEPSDEDRQTTADSAKGAVRIWYAYRSPSVFEMSAMDSKTNERILAMILRRRGMAWKLVDIELPNIQHPTAAAGD